MTMKNNNLYRVVCCGAFLLAISGCDQRRALPATPALPARKPAMVVDQANTEVWNRGWTVISNDLRQTFTPTLPRLMAVEVDLMLGNPGPATDRVTLTIYDAGGRDIASTWRDVPAASGDRVRFVFPGDVAVTPGQSYAVRVSGRVTFGWKYVVGGYERGAATFNGRPLVANTRTTFLFRTLGSN
jgi:hypothetical protein